MHIEGGKQMRRKLTSVLLLFVLVFTSVDITAFATEQETEESAIAETQQTEETGEENEGMTSSASQMQSESSTEKSTEEHSEKKTESEVETETVKTSENVTEIETQTYEKTEMETIETSVCETSESDVREIETESEDLQETVTESENDIDGEQSTEEVIELTSSNELNEAVKNKILSFKTKYPQGTVWGDSFNGQYRTCIGFALKMASEVFNGHWPRTLRIAGNEEESDGWTCYWVDMSNCNTLVAEPGDIIDCPSGTNKNHTAMVLSVSSGKITCLQANINGNNKVYWTDYFNYNSNRATLANIYNVYGNYIQNDNIKNPRKFRLWKPSDDLKRSATGIKPEPQGCDFKGSFTVETDDGDKIYNNKLKISGNASDYYGIKWFRIGVSRDSDSTTVFDDSSNIFYYEYDMSLYGTYTISVDVMCGNGIIHEIGKKKVEYCVQDLISPTVNNVTVTNNGSELYFRADAMDDNGITEAWMGAKDDNGKEQRFEAEVSGNEVSGTWSAGYFSDADKIEITVYAKDAAGNMGSCSIEKNMGGVTVTHKIINLEVNEEAEVKAVFDTLWFVKSTGFGEDNYNLLNITADGLSAKVKALKPGFTFFDFWWNGELGPREMTNGDVISPGAVKVGQETVCAYVVPNAPTISSILAGEYDTVRFKPVEYAETYALYRKMNDTNSEYQLVKEFADDGTYSVKIKSPDIGESYTYKMCAKAAAVKDLNQDGHPMYYPTSKFSNEMECTKKTEPPEEPDQPTEAPSEPETESITETESETPPTETYSEPSTEVEYNGLWISGVSKSGYQYTGEAIKPDIKVYDKTTLLAEKTDYTISYKNNTKVGKATITVTGKGSYSGKETMDFDILPVNIGSEEVHAMDFYVKIGPKAQKPIPELYYMGTKLKNNKDFTISYANTSNVYAQTGEYSVTITGKGNYKGTRVLKLMAVEKIVKPKPVSIAKAALNGFAKSFTYTGKACRQECKLTVKTSEGEKILTEGMDYTVQYANNIKAGTATVTYYGRNRYTGKLKKTYKILPYDILSDPISKIKYENNVECIYAKGGSKPKPVVTFEGKALKEGVDYTLSYKNNQAVYGNQTPCVIVNGTGCFKGKIPINFTLKAQNLSKMTLVSGDKVYKNKANIYKITPKLMDMDGRLLSAGKDFDPKSMTYVYENDVVLENGVSRKAGSGVEKTDIIPADTQIRITLNCGNGGNYIGDFTGTYRITKADIKSAEVAIPKQIYTGNEILLDKSQITVKLSGVILNPEDYEIVRYDNNVKKGTASVTIRGTRNYGGIKTAKFTISTKGLLWWWRK